MPVFGYKCPECDKTKDVIEKFSSTEPRICECGEEMRRTLSSPGLLDFKGVGNYKSGKSSRKGK